MMTCCQLVELLLEFLENELSPDLCCEAQDHLRCCPSCVTFVETYRLTIHLSHCLPPAPLPSATAARCTAALKAADFSAPPPPV